MLYPAELLPRTTCSNPERGGFGSRRFPRESSSNPPSPSSGGIHAASPSLRSARAPVRIPRVPARSPNGERGIRTPDTLLGYNSLAGSPIRPLSHLSKIMHSSERVGFEPTVPYGTTVFKTVSLNRSDIAPTIVVTHFTEKPSTCQGRGRYGACQPIRLLTRQHNIGCSPTILARRYGSESWAQADVWLPGQ